MEDLPQSLCRKMRLAFCTLLVITWLPTLSTKIHCSYSAASILRRTNEAQGSPSGLNLASLSLSVSFSLSPFLVLSLDSFLSSYLKIA
ncbi:hypothetical protein F4778DRAFT_305087 [Xylariomycetidae sp. FL2044]|nr:hypothetical protein F4778DRAFT_305087 [Xylariomycetidae sp. FL2044]